MLRVVVITKIIENSKIGKSTYTSLPNWDFLENRMLQLEKGNPEIEKSMTSLYNHVYDLLDGDIYEIMNKYLSSDIYTKKEFDEVRKLVINEIGNETLKIVNEDIKKYKDF